MTKLTEEQKQEINIYLAEDKPLPLKYRFLLFNDSDVELVWKGKHDDMCKTVLPFQTREQITKSITDESKENNISAGRDEIEWLNKLICGDNKLALSALAYGPLRNEIKKQGGIKLIYIDPPFNAGVNFPIKITVGKKKHSEIAYSDVWGTKTSSFINMIYERLKLMHELLAEDGCIYLHCDWRLNSLLRIILDDIFKFYINEICWHYTGGGRSDNYFSRKHDSIFIYSKSGFFKFNGDAIRIPYKSTSAYAKNGIIAHSGKKYMPNPLGTIPDDVWNIPIINPLSKERTGYPSQKPEALLCRIIKASSNEGDLIADFFCGSGTLPCVAEKLNRKWIAVDLGKFAINTTRKRVLDIQEKLNQNDKQYRGFELLNFSKYQLKNNILEQIDHPGLNLKEKCEDFILKEYRAKAERIHIFAGIKNNRRIVIGPLDGPVTISFIETVLEKAQRMHFREIDLLGFEFEYGIMPGVFEKSRNIDLALKYIPSEIFNERMAEGEQIYFYDLGYIEISPIFDDDKLAIKLKSFSFEYSKESIENMEADLQAGRNRIILTSEGIIKLYKDKNGEITREILSDKWEDWIDYWAVDYAYGSKKVHTSCNKQSRSKDAVQDNHIFNQTWCSYRLGKKRSLELTSEFRKFSSGLVAVKIVDILGNENMMIVDPGTNPL